MSNVSLNIKPPHAVKLRQLLQKGVIQSSKPEEWKRFLEYLRKDNKNLILRVNKIDTKYEIPTDDEITNELIKILTIENKTQCQMALNKCRQLCNHLDIYDILTKKVLCDEYLLCFLFGDPTSRDADICVVVDEQFSNNGMPYLLSEFVKVKIMERLKSVGYEITSISKLDIVTICINNSGRISAISKGSERDIVRIFKATCHLHIKLDDLPFIKDIDDDSDADKHDKMSAIAKFLLDHLEVLALDYNLLRPLKTKAYKEGIDHMIILSQKMFSKLYLDLSNIKSTDIWRNIMKSLVMKYCQIILISQQVPVYEYIKSNLAILIGNKYAKWISIEELEWFLFRGTRGSMLRDPAIILLFLHKEYNKIVNTFFESIKPYYVNIPHNTLTNIEIPPFSCDLIEAFLNSPIKPSVEFTELYDVFVELYKFLYKIENFSLNKAFQSLPPTKEEKKRLEDILGEDKFKQVYCDVLQKSQEWFNMRSEYIGGGSSGKTGDIHNLLRGAITEEFIKDYLRKIVSNAKLIKTIFNLEDNNVYSFNLQCFIFIIFIIFCIFNVYVSIDINNIYSIILYSIISALSIGFFIYFLYKRRYSLTDVKFMDVGIIIDEHKKISCSPDGLLLFSSKKRVVPVEIKSLHSSIKNKDYYRGINLAKKQCMNVKHILNSSNITHYLIILSWYEPDSSLTLELHYKEF